MKLYLVFIKAYRIIYDSDDEAAARAGRDVFIIFQLLPGDLEPITAGARVVVNSLLLIPRHVFNLYLVVISPHCDEDVAETAGR